MNDYGEDFEQIKTLALIISQSYCMVLEDLEAHLFIWHTEMIFETSLHI